jgi:membrane protease YdiL (CAAX protease family)
VALMVATGYLAARVLKLDCGPLTRLTLFVLVPFLVFDQLWRNTADPGGALRLALAFALGHPAPGRAGRLYDLWAFAAGLILGGLYLASGSLVPGILAHFLYNAKGFAEIASEPGPASR